MSTQPEQSSAVTDSSQESVSSSQDTAASSRSRPSLNIPNASQHTMRSSELAQLETENHDDEIYIAQSEALVQALNTHISANGVTLTLSDPLHRDIASQLSDHGYSYSTSSVSTTINGETQSRNTVTIYPEAPRDLLSQTYFGSQSDRWLDDFINGPLIGGRRYSLF